MVIDDPIVETQPRELQLRASGYFVALLDSLRFVTHVVDNV